jgi:hypothetical protein
VKKHNKVILIKVKDKEGFTMVKTNFTKVTAFALAASMVLTSSITAFADTAVTDNGTGTYEGNDVTFAAASSITVPTTPETGFAYIADPNGLIEESAKSHYPDATFASTAKGLFFKTSVTNNKPVYSEKSAALEVINKNAGPVIITAAIKKKDSDASTIDFTDDATFGGDTPSTTKSIYMALSDGTTTKALKSGGSVVSLPIALAGKVGNYELKWDSTLNSNNGGYAYALKSGITTDDAKNWNKTSFYVFGYLNQNAEWTGDANTPPAITVTWDVAAGAAPLKVKNGKASSTTLTHTPSTISKILLGEAEIGADIITRAKASESAAGTVSVTAEQASALYSAIKGQKDGLMLTVLYADGYTEPVVLFSK